MVQTASEHACQKSPAQQSSSPANGCRRLLKMTAVAVSRDLGLKRQGIECMGIASVRPCPAAFQGADGRHGASRTVGLGPDSPEVSPSGAQSPPRGGSPGPAAPCRPLGDGPSGRGAIPGRNHLHQADSRGDRDKKACAGNGVRAPDHIHCRGRRPPGITSGASPLPRRRRGDKSVAIHRVWSIK
jgi:hypothetical protein